MRIRNIFLLTLLIVNSHFTISKVNSQKYDQNWIIGYGSDTSDEIKFGKMILNFDQTPVKITYSPKGKNFDLTFSTACISSKSGEFLFYSDNKYLVSRNHEVLVNGDSINPGIIRDIYIDDGYPTSTASFFIPDPSSENRYYFIHRSMNLSKDPRSIKPLYSDRLYYSLIEINQQNPDGIVIEKNHLLLEGDFVSSHLAACKHGNGRDWWIVLEEAGSDKHYFFLLNPIGIRLHHEQNIGIKANIKDWNGDCLFTPNGQKFIKSTLDDQIQIFNFNRCSGLFFNPIKLNVPVSKNETAIMVCASSNNRFLYASIGDLIFQFDLLAHNIQNSIDTVAIWDGFLYEGLFGTRFYQMQLASNGKIYITCRAGGPFMHVIENPNGKGKDCGFVSRKLMLPANYAFGIPTMPNYKLGPVDNSICDDLDINNNAIAYWTYDELPAIPKKLKFIDLSSPNVNKWLWDFGDGIQSNLQNPEHLFLYSGEYEICLDATSGNSSDQFCRYVSIGNQDSSEYKIKLDINIYPNPFNDHLIIDLGEYNLDNISINVYNTLGMKIYNQKLNNRISNIRTNELAEGIYFAEILSQSRSLKYLVIAKE